LYKITLINVYYNPSKDMQIYIKKLKKLFKYNQFAKLFLM